MTPQKPDSRCIYCTMTMILSLELQDHDTIHSFLSAAMWEIILPWNRVFCCRQQCFSGHNLVFEKEDTQKSTERMEVQRVFCFPLSGLADAPSSLGCFPLPCSVITFLRSSPSGIGISSWLDLVSPREQAY